MSDVDPSFGRDAELHQYATSDLSVEEQLASGASVDDLVAAGVLYDDYDPDNQEEYVFTPLPEREIPSGTGMSKERFDALMAVSDWYNSGRYLREDPSNKPTVPN
ncbi:hypothetical protein BH23CYA1_BH23CYA1_20150 [soil metagenome]